MTFWELLQASRDETGASESWILEKVGVNKGTFSAWRKRGIPVLPPRGVLVRLSAVLKVDYEVLVDTILTDMKFLPGKLAIDEEIRIAAQRRERVANFDHAAWTRRVEAAAQAHSERWERARVDLGFATSSELSELDYSRIQRRVDELARDEGRLSEPGDTSGDAIAAHEEEVPIAGEQEESDTP